LKKIYGKGIFMDLTNLFLLMGQAGGTAASGSSGGAMGGIMSFVPFILIIAIFYFLIIRPQNRKQKKTQAMLSALRKGDEVVTIGGVHGKIEKVRENTVVLKVDDNVSMEFTRGAISSVTRPKDEDEEEDDKKGKDEKALPDKSGAAGGLKGLFGKKKEKAEEPAEEEADSEEKTEEKTEEKAEEPAAASEEKHE
jgi:preprotein translocase subunit YajC